MKSLILIFPGQASQYVGMGKDLYNNSTAAKRVLDQVVAMEDLKDIQTLCFAGPADLLTRTDNVQPAITAVSVMTLSALHEAARNRGVNIQIECTAGHSLGEYAAHVAAENLELETAMELVKWRGYWMNEAAQPPNPAGAMVAVMGISFETVEKTVAEFGGEKVGIANINSPGQIILSGEKQAVEKVAEEAKEAGAKRCIMLNVSGAWHSPLMAPAQEKMAGLLKEKITTDTVQMNSDIPVVANASGEAVKSVDELRMTLTNQITSPVRWEECVRKLISISGHDLPHGVLDGFDYNALPLFVEVGPGKVLKGLIKSIDRNVECMNIEDMASLKALMERLG